MPVSSPLKVLMVEDSEADALLILRELRRGGFEVFSQRCWTARDLDRALAERSWDLVISDYRMPAFDGGQALSIVRAVDKDLPFIVVSGTIGEEIAVAAMRQGATDYLLKDRLARLVPAVRQALQQRAALQKAAVQYRELHEQFVGFFESSTDGMGVADLHGKILDLNSSYRRLLGYTKEELLGRTYFSLTPAEYGPQQHRNLARMRKVGEPVEYEKEFFRKDGSRVPVLVTAFPLRRAEGVIIGLGAIIKDITERKRAEEELKRSRQELRELAARLLRVREEEAKRIARELHDELGQTLTGLKLDAGWLGRRLAGLKLGLETAPLSDRLRVMAETIDKIIPKVRQLCSDLRPGVLDNLGLVAALEWQAGDFEARSGIKCRMKLPRTEVRLSGEAKTAIFRVFQETLTNVARHAGASVVSVCLKRRGATLLFTVHDNGRGMPASALSKRGRLGLLGIRERLFALKGTVDFVSGKTGGTTVTVTVPLK